MSAHSKKARNRHPDPKTYKREAFPVSHVIFEVCDHPVNGKTFALFAGDFPVKDRRPMFSGHINKGMGTQLRKLAHRIDELEADL